MPPLLKVKSENESFECLPVLIDLLRVSSSNWPLSAWFDSSIGVEVTLWLFSVSFVGNIFVFGLFGKRAEILIFLFRIKIDLD